jgi:hypothetical protein
MAQTDQSFVSPEVRCGYVNVFQPRTNINNNKEEYSLQMILRKKEDAQFIKQLQTAIDGILAKVFPKGTPAAAWYPLKDAEEYYDEKGKPLPEYLEDCMFLNVKNITAPGIVDKDKMEIIDPMAFQSGDYARVHFNLYGYAKGSGGVSASLQNVLVTQKGEALGSRVRAEEAFKNVEVEDDWAA